jgi:predicted ATPase
MFFLALALWPLGDVERAVSLARSAEARIAGLTHIGTLAYGKAVAALFELMRGDLSLGAQNAVELARVIREHDLPYWRGYQVFLERWTRVQSGAHADGLADMSRGVELRREQSVLITDSQFKLLLAEAEARSGDVERALSILDEALATSERIGHRYFDAELHRARGEMLLRRDRANSAPAEEAFQSAIAVAREQHARSFELRAALVLAKLYHSTSRLAEAHAVLAPALEGFAPTREMPEIAEAEALLAALAESHDVKREAAQRRRRLDLQTSYGRALLWAKGFAAEETKAAFARAQEIAGSAKEPAARIAIHDAECLRTFMRGEFREAQEIAETMLHEAGAEAHGPEAGAFRLMLGLIRLYQGELKAAQTIFERELTDFELGPAGRVNAAAFLALTEWHLGEVVRARQHIQQAVQQANEMGDVERVATGLFFRTVLESRREDASATRLAVDALLELSQKHGMRTYLDEGRVYANWARGRLFDPDFGADKLEQALGVYVAQGNRADAPSLYGLLAELQAGAREFESALASIDQGLAIADETGDHF